jgi:hypothetical protein
VVYSLVVISCFIDYTASVDDDEIIVISDEEDDEING